MASVFVDKSDRGLLEAMISEVRNALIPIRHRLATGDARTTRDEALLEGVDRLLSFTTDVSNEMDRR